MVVGAWWVIEFAQNGIKIREQNCLDDKPWGGCARRVAHIRFHSFYFLFTMVKSGCLSKAKASLSYRLDPVWLLGLVSDSKFIILIHTWKLLKWYPSDVSQRYLDMNWLGDARLPPPAGWVFNLDKNVYEVECSHLASGAMEC